LRVSVGLAESRSSAGGADACDPLLNRLPVHIGNKWLKNAGEKIATGLRIINSNA
jgi:hypothetical protein